MYVCSRNFRSLLNFSSYEGLRLQPRGDGQRYKIKICCVSWDSVA
jgi:hypothetical protein